MKDDGLSIRLAAAVGRAGLYPLEWDEVEEGRIRPGDFNMETIFPRFKAKGNIYAEVITLRQPLDDLIRLL